jgi:hypothetical protein
MANAAAVLWQPSASCAGSGTTSTVTFKWTPLAGGIEQWIDLSLQDNGFAEGTYITSGPFSRSVASYEWAAIRRALPHYWRVNTLTADGWRVSQTGAFVPCTGPVLLQGPLACQPSGRATVTIRWAPPAPPAQLQWVDISETDGAFAQGTFTGIGPLGASTSSQIVTSLSGQATYYFRVNSLTASGWQSSSVGAFDTRCGAG